MKKLLPLLVCGLLLFSVNAHSQTEWETQSRTFKITPNNSLDISNVSSNSATLHNWIAETKENKKRNIITNRDGVLPIYIYRSTNDPALRVSFNIQDINNDPTNYKYAVQNADGKTEYTCDIYWGITIYMGGTDGKEYHMQYTFNNKGGTSNPLYSRSASRSFKMSGKGVLNGTFDDGWRSCYGLPSTVEITLQENNHCEIGFDNHYIPWSDFTSVNAVRRIEFNLYAGAKLRIYNIKVEKQSIYAKVSSFIMAGDNKMNDGNYYQAASEYSKAID